MDFKAMFTDFKDYSNEYDKKEIESGKVMAILSYLGILCLIPYFAEKDNKYVRFHVVQGLNIFLLEVIYSVALSMLTAILIFIPFVGAMLIGVLSLISSGFLVLAIWGIVYVFQDKAKEVPVVNQIKIIKK